MNANDPASTRPRRSPLAALRQRALAASKTEPCDLCGAALTDAHPHLFTPAERKLVCVCDACAILLSGGPGSRYRRVPRRVQQWPELRLSEAQWRGLLIPIGLAFFFHSTPAGRVVALYPSPAGATEALPPLEAWQELVADNPRLAELEPDVEALLVNRIQEQSSAYRVPIDECFRLVGIIRLHWRGFSGGSEMWEQVGHFFAQLKQRSSADSE